MAKEFDNERVSIPLMMLKGNLDALLENKIECEGLTMKRYGMNGVVLTIHTTPEQRATNLKLGFRTAKIEEE